MRIRVGGIRWHDQVPQRGRFDLPNESNLGAYGVRYLFVILGFSLTEAEDSESQFLLGRALEDEGSEPF